MKGFNILCARIFSAIHFLNFNNFQSIIFHQLLFIIILIILVVYYR